MATKKDTTLSAKDIDTKVSALSEKLRSIRFSVAGSRSKNVKEQTTVRREIARLLTLKAGLTK